MHNRLNRAFLGLGSNIGDRKYTLGRAVHLIHQVTEIEVLQSSSLYETDPVGYTEQDVFLNIAIEIETSLPPEELLTHMQRIETLLGRTRMIRWGPRTLDIDILLYGHEYIHHGDLQVPHPRMMERAFVLVPLAEIAPEAPIAYKTGEEVRYTSVEDALEKLEDTEGVRQCGKLGWKHVVEERKG
ncbi:2-amino-4-hydroxy-6-hydroxymethyldihydropteridine diphosphokinase [Aneurinibacillus aneurinilyticus]|uniref:2-amino-4-hydroxy-6-hydroxymethyldihydropteridine diphosphokinase n=1 Tax=Aneurinibacillus aneurinilyticus TaxID=1391 RepID=A0A848D044_ANEAE|nr:2-amino-4-hydroxy-6-hydroxymethyldihydropteridine diphosphokinase [Aneurinibacillus aneurinilyticus]NMF00120.1 2-amino-4-hydroxy-6-hydroxymethyldihydropteridine diphosphokinase [Aneurinibacillus aneurinilyticus]